MIATKVYDLGEPYWPSDFKVILNQITICLHKHVLLQNLPFYREAINQDETAVELNLTQDKLANNTAFCSLVLSFYIQNLNVPIVTALEYSILYGQQAFDLLYSLITEERKGRTCEIDTYKHSLKVTDQVTEIQSTTNDLLEMKGKKKRKLELSDHVDNFCNRLKKTKQKSIVIDKKELKEISSQEKIQILFDWYEIGIAYEMKSILQTLAKYWYKIFYPSKEPLSVKLEILQSTILYLFDENLSVQKWNLEDFKSTHLGLSYLCLLLYRAASLTFYMGSRVLLVNDYADNENKKWVMIQKISYAKTIDENRKFWVTMHEKLPKGFLVLYHSLHESEFSKMATYLAETMGWSLGLRRQNQYGKNHVLTKKLTQEGLSLMEQKHVNEIEEPCYVSNSSLYCDSEEEEDGTYNPDHASLFPITWTFHLSCFL